MDLLKSHSKFEGKVNHIGLHTEGVFRVQVSAPDVYLPTGGRETERRTLNGANPERKLQELTREACCWSHWQRMCSLIREPAQALGMGRWRPLLVDLKMSSASFTGNMYVFSIRLSRNS